MSAPNDGGAAKCGEGRFCRRMLERMEDEANARRKGLVQIDITDMDTGDTRTIGVAFKQSSSDRGLMLNVCPWCAQPIMWAKAEGQ